MSLLLTPDPPAWLAERYTVLGRIDGSARFANPHALPRVRFVSHAQPEPRGLQGAAAALVAPGFDPRARVMLDGAPAPQAEVAAAQDAALELTTDLPERIAVYTRSAGAGYLVVGDAWFPGWEAELDGDPVPLLRANLAFRAVAVPAGEHKVVMAYRPRPLRTGFALAGAALAALGLCYALERRFSRGRSRRSRPPRRVTIPPRPPAEPG